MDPDATPSPGIRKPIIAVALLVVLLPVLFWLSRLSSRRDFDERKSVRDRGAEACGALDRPSAGLAEVTAAVDAFEADMQLVLSVAARQAESQLQGGTQAPGTISDLAADCHAVYDGRP